MTNLEFLNEFEVYYNNIMSNAAPGLNTYEISIFLTRAQELIIKLLYSGDDNIIGFEITEEIKRSLDNLIVTSEPLVEVPNLRGLTDYSKFYKIPEDAWLITYESIKFNDTTLGCKNNSVAQVKPVTQDALWRLIDNPFKGPTERRVLRLDNSNNIVELVSKYTIKEYIIRYIRKPKPIIVEDLTEYNTTIDGESAVTQCTLNSILHRPILLLAVQLAKEAYIGK